MKIIAVERVYNEWPEAARQALASDAFPAPACLKATLMTDSAVVRCGTPLFLPDFAVDWRLEIIPVAVISRLGKWIEPRFAHRYYTEVSLAARLVPPQGAPCGAFEANFDGAIAPGHAVAAPSDGAFTICLDEKEEISLSAEMLHMDDTVALASRFMMLKTGDIIAPCRTPLYVTPVPGTRVSATLNGVPVIDLKIR